MFSRTGHLYMKDFCLDGQSRRAKVSSQLINLPDVRSLMKKLKSLFKHFKLNHSLQPMEEIQMLVT